jgi:hypothetical protein
MTVYKYEPKPLKIGAYTAVIILVSAGIMLFFPTPLPKNVSLLLPYVGILAFLVAFATYCKYIRTSYIYTVEISSVGSLDFTVTQLFFKRKRTVCRISVSDVTELCEIQRRKRRKQKENFESRKKSATYKYFSELFCRSYCIIYLSENENGESIAFTPDEKLKKIILNNKRS